MHKAFMNVLCKAKKVSELKGRTEEDMRKLIYTSSSQGCPQVLEQG